MIIIKQFFCKIIINLFTKMQVLQISLMKALVNLLAPTSPAFGNGKNLFFAK